MTSEAVRLRLLFDDRHILSKSKKKEGIKRCWFLLKPHLNTISDPTSHLQNAFCLHRTCPHGITLSMDGFVLPSFELTCILKDKYIVYAKRKGSVSIDDKPAINGNLSLELPKLLRIEGFQEERKKKKKNEHEQKEREQKVLPEITADHRTIEPNTIAPPISSLPPAPYKTEQPKKQQNQQKIKGKGRSRIEKKGNKSLTSKLSSSPCAATESRCAATNNLPRHRGLLLSAPDAPSLSVNGNGRMGVLWKLGLVFDIYYGLLVVGWIRFLGPLLGSWVISNRALRLGWAVVCSWVFTCY